MASLNLRCCAFYLFFCAEHWRAAHNRWDKRSFGTSWKPVPGALSWLWRGRNLARQVIYCYDVYSQFNCFHFYLFFLITPSCIKYLLLNHFLNFEYQKRFVIIGNNEQSLICISVIRWPKDGSSSWPLWPEQTISTTGTRVALGRTRTISFTEAIIANGRGWWHRLDPGSEEAPTPVQHENVEGWTSSGRLQ